MADNMLAQLPVLTANPAYMGNTRPAPAEHKNNSKKALCSDNRAACAVLRKNCTRFLPVFARFVRFCVKIARAFLKTLYKILVSRRKPEVV